MVLIAVTMDRGGNFRPFHCGIPKLEAAFDVFSAIVATGDVLISVDLVDNNQRTPLPVEAFDGEPLGEHMTKLEQEWQVLLSDPVSQQAAYHWMLARVCRQLQDTYQAHIDWLERAINDTNARIEKLPRTPHWESFCVHLELQVTLYLRQLEETQVKQQRFCQRLASYLDSQ